MALVERLIISMPAYREVETEQIEIAKRRLAEMESGNVEGVPGELVLAKIQSSLEARRSR